MLQKCSIIKIMNIFFEEPSKEHYLMEISRKSGLAHTSVKEHLNELKKMDLITELFEKKGKRKFPLYNANINDKQYKFYKKILNIVNLEKSGLIDFIKNNFMPNSIILFGSYSKGEDIDDSDIDLFIECKEEKIDIKRFEKILKRKIQLHFKNNFNSFPKELKNNIINGIILFGYLEAFK